MNIQQLRYRDRLLKAITTDGFHRISLVVSTNVVEIARKRHGLSMLMTVLLGRALTANLLMASNLKGEERIRIKMEGSGPAKALYSEASSHGEARGYAVDPLAEINLHAGETLHHGFGAGFLSISKVLYNHAKPVTGMVTLAGGTVADDLAHYLVQSEQVPSAVSLDVSLDRQGAVARAGGVLVQALPGADPAQTTHLQENLKHMPSISDQLAEGYLDELLNNVTQGTQTRELSRYPVDFFCRCSKDRFRQSLRLLDPDELLEMDAESEEMVCNYCSERYIFSQQELQAIAMEGKVRQN